MSSNNLIAKAKCGLLKSRFCSAGMADIWNPTTVALNDDKAVNAVSLDMSKAFVRVPHVRFTVALIHFTRGWYRA